MKASFVISMSLFATLLCGSCVKEIEDTEYHGDLTLTVSDSSVSWDQTVTVRASFGDYNGPEITRCGVCYSEQPNPTVTSGTLLTATPSNGKFSVSFSYPGGTKIYLRAFAENVNGITYSEQDIVIQPLKNYSQLNLSSFTALSSRSFDTVRHPEDPDYYTDKHYGIKGIRSILVTSLATYDWATSPDGEIFINCSNTDSYTSGSAYSERHSNTDQFDIWEAMSGLMHGYWNAYSTGGPLFDNNIVGYTAHVYSSGVYSSRKVKSTRTNLGWLLEFNQPVCLTYTEWDTDVSKIYYSTNP